MNRRTLRSYVGSTFTKFVLIFPFKDLLETVKGFPRTLKNPFSEFTLQRCFRIRLRLLLLLRGGRRGCAMGQHLDESSDEFRRRVLLGRLHRYALRWRHLLRDPHLVHRGCLSGTVWSAKTLVSRSRLVLWKQTLCCLFITSSIQFYSFIDPKCMHNIKCLQYCYTRVPWQWL